MMTNRNLKEMSMRIKERRKQLCFTQEKFSEVIDISASSYTKIENAFQKPSLDTLIVIAKNLNLSLDYIVFGDDEPEKIIDQAAVESIISLSDLDKLAHARNVLDRLINLKNDSAESKV